MKMTQMRVSKLEKTFGESPMGLALELVHYLADDDQFTAAITRQLLAAQYFDLENPEIHRQLLESLGEPLEVQPGDEAAILRAFETIPDDLRRRLHNAGFDI